MAHGATLHHVGDSFAVIEAETLQRTPTLSFRAKGVFATLRSYPEGWRFNMKHLQGLATEGREALRSAMAELREHGYVRYERVTDPETGLKGGMRILVSRLPRDDWKADRGPGSPGDGFLGDRNAVPISSTKESNDEEAKASSSQPTKTQENLREGKSREAATPDGTSPEELDLPDSFFDEDGASQSEAAPQKQFENLKEPEPEKPKKARHPLGSFIGEVLKAWAEHKHFAWPDMDRLSGRGAKYTKEFLAHYDGDVEKAAENMRLAIRWASEKEDWWRERGTTTFDQLAANNKLESYADLARHELSRGSANRSGGEAWGTPAGKDLEGCTVRLTNQPGWLVKLVEHDPVMGDRYWAEYQPKSGKEWATPDPRWVRSDEIAGVVS